MAGRDSGGSRGLAVGASAAIIAMGWFTLPSEASLSAPEGEEREELRTAYSNTVLLEDGVHQAEIFTQPVNYEVDDGSFEPIDNTLVPSSRPGYAFENAANSYKVFFPERLEEEPVLIEAKGESLSFQLQGASGAPVASGASITYEVPHPTPTSPTRLVPRPSRS